MKNAHFTPTLLAMAVLVGACSSVPTTTSLLDQTRIDYQAAQSSPAIASYAQLEMKQAGEALARADAAAGNNDDEAEIDKLAYLAKQKIALTQEVAKQKSAEADVASAGKERDQMRLTQRTNEADQAKQSAEQSMLVAIVAQGDAAVAEGKMQDAQAQAAKLEAQAAKLEAQLAELTAKKTERGIVITLGDVLFGTDLARLNTDGMRTAQKLADILQQNPQRNVLIEGFTDSTGSASHNLELSERRAAAVRSALQEIGVASERVTIQAYGETHPVAANDTKENRQLNRRVEIILSDAMGKIVSR